MQFPYSSEYFPPAPHVEIFIGLPDRAFALGPLPAFVDSGADATIVPHHYLNVLPAKPFDHKWLRSQWGERRQVRLFVLDIGIGEIRLPGIDIVEDHKSDEIILGRNVLNMLRIYLDGPKQVVTLSD